MGQAAGIWGRVGQGQKTHGSDGICRRIARWQYAPSLDWDWSMPGLREENYGKDGLGYGDGCPFKTNEMRRPFKKRLTGAYCV